MPRFRDLPILRVLYRYYSELTRPAPLVEFQDYDAYWVARLRDQRVSKDLHRYRIVASKLPDDTSVLDIGCGDGAFLRYLQKAKPNCRTMGADTSGAAMKQLRDSGIPGIHLDGDLPLAVQITEYYENIVLMEVIEHVIESEELVRQVIDLQPKRIFITIPNVGFLMHRLRLMFVGRFPVTSIFYHMKEHVRFWTVTDFYEWAESLGLTVLSHNGQIDRNDKILVWLVRAAPRLFADRMVYELELRSEISTK